MYQKAGAKAGIGGLGTHSLRHMYRSWLDAVGTPVAVQQKLMRHADIRTTMNIYGDIVTDALIMMIQRSNFKRDDSPVRLAFQKAALE